MTTTQARRSVRRGDRVEYQRPLLHGVIPVQRGTVAEAGPVGLALDSGLLIPHRWLTAVNGEAVTQDPDEGGPRLCVECGRPLHGARTSMKRHPRCQRAYQREQERRRATVMRRYAWLAVAVALPAVAWLCRDTAPAVLTAWVTWMVAGRILSGIGQWQPKYTRSDRMSHYQRMARA